MESSAPRFAPLLAEAMPDDTALNDLLQEGVTPAAHVGSHVFDVVTLFEEPLRPVLNRALKGDTVRDVEFEIKPPEMSGHFLLWRADYHTSLDGAGKTVTIGLIAEGCG
jgi:hypothetical protein